MKNTTSFLGKGMYTVAEASRLTRVTAQRIARWVSGYGYKREGEQRRQSAIWEAHRREKGCPLTLTFLDLLEVRLVNEFCVRGVSLATLRKVSKKAREEFALTHPFVSLKFKTDGRVIFCEQAGGQIYEFLENQKVFAEAVSPFLKDVDFSGNEARLWWPAREQAPRVVLDPERCFGKPIINKGSVPTIVLADAYEAEEDAKLVARWFNVAPSAVLDAYTFEEKLRAA